MPDNLRGEIEAMGAQTTLETCLSIWASQIVEESITVDYTQSESGVHAVSSVVMYPQYYSGIAYLLDGDALWSVEIVAATDEEVHAMLDSVLEQVR